MIIKDICIIKGATLYGAMNAFNQDIKWAFEEQGINATILDLTVPHSIAEVEDFLSGIGAILAFNGMGINDSGVFRDMVNSRNIPCISFLIDHPYHHNVRLLNAVDRQIVITIDRRHVDYLNKYYPNIKYALFIPHGGSKSNLSNKPFDDRRYDISFLGSYSDSAKNLDSMNNYNANMQELLITIVENVWSGRDKTLEDSAIKIFRQYGLIDYDKEIPELIAEIKFLDNYIRSERRRMMIEMVISAGYEIHVFGRGWDQFKSDNVDRLIIHDPVDYMESLDVMADSKIVLNNMPLFTDGSHDRVFSALASGSICMTDSSEYFKEIFNDREDLLYFSWDKPDEMADKIKNVLTKQMDVDKIIASGQKKTLDNHMWSNRVSEIINYLDGIEFDD